MPYDQALSERLQDLLAGESSVVPKKMFGGMALMVRGNMCVGVIDDRLVARVGVDRFADLVAQPHAAPMDFTGRPMKGWIYIAPEGLESEDDLRHWVDAALAFNQTLPAK